LVLLAFALTHLTFEYIHPFVDGNGRIGRVINNYLLIREGFVPINIKFIDRKKYYEAFKEFDAKNMTVVMEEIVGRALTNSYHKRLAYLEGKKIITLSQYAKDKKISHSNLINKANRQTIEAFLEKNVWKIGV
jgi:Fic family protein